MKGSNMIDVLTLVVVCLVAVGLVAWKLREVLRRNDIKVRYAVTLKGNEGDFAGLLVEESWRTMTFENCVTIPW